MIRSFVVVLSCLLLLQTSIYAQGFQQTARGGTIKGDIDGFGPPDGFEHPLPDSGPWPSGSGYAFDWVGNPFGSDYVESVGDSSALAARSETRGHSFELGVSGNHLSGLTRGMANAVSVSRFIPGGGQYEAFLKAKFTWGVTAPDTLRDRYANESFNGSGGRIDVDHNTYEMRQWCEQVQVSNGEMVGRWRTDLYVNGDIEESIIQKFPQQNYNKSGTYSFDGLDEVMAISFIGQNCRSDIQVVNLMNRTAIYANAYLDVH